MRLSHSTAPLLVTALAALLGTACATVPVSEEAIDWKAVDSRWSVHVVTVDPDGDERVTRVWLALVDGVGTIEETSELIAFLASSRSSFCTGGDYLIDGALTAHIGV